jgi:hypothetical protein
MALFRGSVDGRWGEGITRQTKGSGVREENQPTIEEREIVRYNAASRAENEGVEREGAHDIARGVWGGGEWGERKRNFTIEIGSGVFAAHRTPPLRRPSPLSLPLTACTDRERVDA